MGKLAFVCLPSLPVHMNACKTYLKLIKLNDFLNLLNSSDQKIKKKKQFDSVIDFKKLRKASIYK
jgi:hypothetical protein